MKKVYNFRYSDAGRDRKQANDCAVRALALTCNVPYSVAYNLFQAAGRKQNRGVDLGQLQLALPCYWRRHLYKSTPEQFMAGHPQGRYILNMREHVSCVIDGCMYDTNSYFGKLIYSYYEIHN